MEQLDRQIQEKERATRGLTNRVHQLQDQLSEAIADKEWLQLRQKNPILQHPDWVRMNGIINTKVDQIITGVTQSNPDDPNVRSRMAKELKKILDDEVGQVEFPSHKEGDLTLPKRGPQKRLRRWTVVIVNPYALTSFGSHENQSIFIVRKTDDAFHIWDNPVEPPS
jgi:hypothetical protein